MHYKRKIIHLRLHAIHRRLQQPQRSKDELAATYFGKLWQGYLQPGRTVHYQAQQSTVSRWLQQSTVSRWLQQSTVSRWLDMLSIPCQSGLPCARRLYPQSRCQASRVAHWKILLNTTLLCSSALHSCSLSLSRRRFSLPAVLTTRSMHALSETSIHSPLLVLACMQLSCEMFNFAIICDRLWEKGTFVAKREIP